MTSASMPADALPPPPRSPDVPAPPRRARSIRRTSSIDVDWPDGQAGAMRLTARARDIATRAAAAPPVVLAEDAFVARMDAQRRLSDIRATMGPVRLADLIGQRAGGHLRKAIADHVPEVAAGGSPLHLILDDLSGTSLIAPWAWSLWIADWHEEMARRKADPALAQAFERENICVGMRTGSSGLSFMASGVATDDLRDPADPEGWHAFPSEHVVSLRRARRIDVTPGRTPDGRIEIDAHFQDSATTPGGGREALHEYRLRATADPVSLEVLTLVAEPRVLPFAECPAAAANVAHLIGTPLPRLRAVVLERLRGTAGCTHLNDALRALAEVPVLARLIAGQVASPS